MAKYSGVWWIKQWTDINDSHINDPYQLNKNTRLGIYGLFGIFERNI